ncbi:MAG: hypothetical protein RL253_1459, partial [Bacteroidota bacterium]
TSNQVFTDAKVGSWRSGIDNQPDGLLTATRSLLVYTISGDA